MTGSPTTEPQPDDDVEYGVMLVEARPCNGTTVSGGAVIHGRRCPMHGDTMESQLVAAEARGWRNAVAALRSDAGRGKAARLLLDLDGEITGRTIANAMADFLESTGGQP